MEGSGDGLADLLEAEGDPATREVVRGQFDEDAIPGEYLDVVLPHLPADVRQHFVSVPEFDLELGSAKRLRDDAFDFDGFLLVQITLFGLLANPVDRTRGHLRLASNLLRIPQADKYSGRYGSQSPFTGMISSGRLRTRIARSVVLPRTIRRARPLPRVVMMTSPARARSEASWMASTAGDMTA